MTISRLYFPAYEAICGYDCSYEYALLNEAEYAIEYVYLQFIREENIAFDRDRLPDFEYGDYIVD